VRSPNELCTPAGPGVGEGGQPDMPGANCSPLGNVLTETNGNMISIEFTNQVKSVAEIGMLNVDDSSTTVTVSTASSSTTLPVPKLGQNSVQSVIVGTEAVSSLKVTLGGLNAITYIDFCYFPETRAPNFVGPPALNPTPIVPSTAAPPSGAPPTGAEPIPSEPTIAEPTPSEPTPPEPTVAEPTPSEPTVAEPTPSEPTAAEPTPSEPTVAEPTPSEPTAAEPTPSEPTATEPTPSEPTAAVPTPSEPTAAEPTPSEPTAAEPTPSEPTAAQPTPSEPTPAAPTGGEPTPATPTDSSAPTPPATSPPTPATGTSTPTPPPIDACVEATIDFDTLPDGTQLSGGLFVDDEYLEFYGFTMSAIGGLGDVPRLFNTTDFGLGTSRNQAIGRYVLQHHFAPGFAMSRLLLCMPLLTLLLLNATALTFSARHLGLAAVDLASLECQERTALLWIMF